MNKRLLITICAVTLVVLAAVAGFIQMNQQTPVEVESVPLTFQPVSVRHFYNALTDSERNIYYAVLELLEQYRGGEIVLDYPITTRSYYRIETALLYDSEKHWYLVSLAPYDANFEYVMVHIEQWNPEPIIHRLALLVETEVFRQDLEKIYIGSEDFLEEQQDDPESLYQSLITDIDRLNELNTDHTFYSAINEEIENALNEIINSMPEGLDQEGAVLYFIQWMVDNLRYDPIMENYILTGDPYMVTIARQLAAGSIISLLNREGVCAGFSIIINALSHRVGIESYMIIGMTHNERHTWNAFIIGGEVFYLDPTYDIANGSVRPLMARGQFYARHPGYRPFNDLFEDLWIR